MADFVKSTDTGVTQRTNTYAAAKMLSHAKPHLVLDRFGDAKKMPKNKSTSMTMRRPRVFSAQTTPLLEGVTPDPTTFRFDDVQVTLNQYGQIIQTTDVIQDTHEDPVLQEISEQAGENIGRTIEQLNYAVLKAGTNVSYSNGSSRGDVNTPISLNVLRGAVRTLKRNKARKMTKVLGAGPNYNTFAVEPCFVAVIHVDLESDVRNLPGFKPRSEYATQQEIHEHEFGAVEEVRFVCSADLDPWADAGGTATGVVSTTGSVADVYPILLFGKEAWCHVSLRGYDSVSPSIIPTNQRTKDDPLGQRGIVGWKTWHAAVITNELWMLRIECAATSL